MGGSSGKVGLFHDTFQIGIKFVVFATNHVSKFILLFSTKTDNFYIKFFSEQFALIIHVQVYLFISPCIKNCVV